MMNNAIMVRGEINSMIGWNPPTRNTVKLNADGACKERDVDGCGSEVLQNPWISAVSSWNTCGMFLKVSNSQRWRLTWTPLILFMLLRKEVRERVKV